jgi:hypothetical protein
MPLELDRSYTLHCLKQTGQRELPDAAASTNIIASGFDTAPPFGAQSPIA